MIKEIKKQRELLRFGKFIDDTVKYGNRFKTSYVHEYYINNSPFSFTIYTYNHISHDIFVHINNIIEFFGDSLTQSDLKVFFNKRHKINEYTIHT